MDAALASLEAKASQVQANSKVKADQFIADLKKRRDESLRTSRSERDRRPINIPTSTRVEKLRD